MKKLYVLFFAMMGFCLSNLMAQTEFFYEDFDSGLPALWQAIEVTGDGTPSANWNWTDIGPTGPYNLDPLESESAGNGWMVFDSDLNCSGEQEAWLISEGIDASGKEIVVVQFQTVYGRFNDITSVDVSTDLSNWTIYPLFEDFSFNNFTDDNPTFVNVDISDSAANESNIYLRFRFLSDATTDQGGNLIGCAYSWQIDDVRLLEDDPTPLNDMRANTNWFAIPSSFAMPYSQVDPIRFMTDIENIGQEDQTGVSVNVEITNVQTAELVFSSSLAYGTITADSLAENQVFPDIYTPPMDTFGYVGTYTVVQNQVDEVPENNNIPFSFIVTDTVFAKSDGQRLFDVSVSSQYWSYGNHYYLPNGEGYKATTALIGVGNSDEFVGELELALYEWEDMNNDSTSIESERTKIAISEPYIVLPGDDFIQLNFIATDGSDDVILKDDTHYLLMIHTKSFNAVVATLFAAEEDDFNYFPTTFATSGNDDWRERRFGSFLGTGSDNMDLDSREFTPSYNFTALARLHIQPVNPTSGVEDFNESVSIAVSPNPADQYLSLSIQTPEALSSLNFELLNMEGKVVHTKRFTNVFVLDERINVDDIPSGSYIVRLQSENQVYNRTIIIQH